MTALLARRSHAGQQNFETTALSHTALHLNVPAHELGQLATDGQAQARAPVFPTGARALLLEGFKDQFQFFPGDAHPGILDGNGQIQPAAMARCRLGADPDVAGLREFNGIVHEIGHHLPQAHIIQQQQFSRIPVHIHLQQQGFLLETHPEHLPHLFEQLRQPGGDLFNVQLPRLHLGQVQDLVEQVQQAFPRRKDGGDIGGLPGILDHGVQDLGKADDRIQGRTDLVTHIGQKFPLGLVGPLQLRLLLFTNFHFRIEGLVQHQQFPGPLLHPPFQFLVGAFQGLFHLFPLGDVPGVDHVAPHRRMLQQIGGNGLQNTPISVPVADAVFHHPGLAHPQNPIFKTATHLLFFTGMGQFKDLRVHEILPGIAQDPLRGRTHVGKPPPLVQNPDHVRGIFNEGPEMLLPLLHLPQ